MAKKIIQNNLGSLSRVPENHGSVMMLRHSHREDIPEGEFGNEIRLTEKGKASAMLLGREFTVPVVGVWSSPIERCVQTGECILSGARNRDVIN